MGSRGDFAVKLQLIERLGRNCFGKDGVKAIGRWSEHHIGNQNRDRQNKGKVQRTMSGSCADRGRAPDCRSGVKAADVRSILEDDARAEEAHAGGDIANDPPFGHLGCVLPAFCPQITPIGPFLPVMQVPKYCVVYILRFELIPDMEEVIGSIQIRSTKINNLDSY